MALELAVRCQQRYNFYVLAGSSARKTIQRRMEQLLEEAGMQSAPPQLLLLLVTGISAKQAASLQVRRRLQQQLAGRSGCEVVVGPCDPTQQLAGLPEALQQALT
jgi:hypothetical protein